MDVIISDEALEDLDEIWKFVAKSPRASADRLLADLIRRCYSLEDHPDGFAAVPALKRDQMRRCTLRTWAIFLVIMDTYVDVLHVVHGGQDMSDLL